MAAVPCRAAGVMVARGAMWNPSVFRRPAPTDQNKPDLGSQIDGSRGGANHGMLPLYDVSRRYLGLAEASANHFRAAPHLWSRPVQSRRRESFLD